MAKRSSSFSFTIPACAKKRCWTKNSPKRRPRKSRRRRPRSKKSKTRLKNRGEPRDWAEHAGIDSRQTVRTYSIELPDVNYFTRQVLCREGCPVRTDAGAYVQAIAEGRYEDAYIIARTPNPFASICGRVCAAPCEAK